MLDPISFDAFFEQSDQLLADLGVPATTSLPDASAKRLPTRTRSGLAEVDEILRMAIQCWETAGPYVGFCLWLVEVCVNRRRDQARKLLEFYVGLLTGQFAARGLEQANKDLIKEMAYKELVSFGVDEESARKGSQSVLEYLLAALPPKQPAVDAWAEFSKIIALAQCVSDWQVEERKPGCVVQVPVPEGEKVRVYMIPHKKDEQEIHWVELLSRCGPANQANFKKVLRQSSQLEVGAIVLRTLQETDVFVIRETLALEQVSLPELRRVVTTMASKAAQFREELGLVDHT